MKGCGRRLGWAIVPVAPPRQYEKEFVWDWKGKHAETYEKLDKRTNETMNKADEEIRNIHKWLDGAYGDVIKQMKEERIMDEAKKVKRKRLTQEEISAKAAKEAAQEVKDYCDVVIQKFERKLASCQERNVEDGTA